MRRAPLVLALSLASLGPGCALAPGPAALTRRDEVRTEIGTFELAYLSGDEHSRDGLVRAIRAATPKLARWGTLHSRVQVTVLPSHEALEAAVNRRDYRWLRAWARYDEILVQSPRTWTLVGANPAEVDELMLHEITHCLMYQRSARRDDWMHKQIPLWFREGMASVTAGQGFRWPSLEDLARLYAEGPDKDPLDDPDSLYRGENPLVYGAAHHAFTFLLRRYGRDAATRVMAGMADGATFPDAFQRGTGLSASDFTADFKRFVRLRGFQPARPR